MSQDPRALLQQADKAAAGASGGFSFFGGRQEKWENAADLYRRAANAFRLKDQDREAGQAFEKCAAIQTQNLNELDDAANTLTDAYKAYYASDPVNAARCLEISIKRYLDNNALRRAATHLHNLGELYEKKVNDLQKAIGSYEQAARLFDRDLAPALASKSWLAAAQLIALDAPRHGTKTANEYYRAIEIFEKAAESAIGNNIMQFSVKDYLFKAGLCHLAVNDHVTTKRAFLKYGNMDESFIRTNECGLLTDLFIILSQVTPDQGNLFETKVNGYKSVNKLDELKSEMLKRINKFVAQKAEHGNRDDNGDDDFS